MLNGFSENLPGCRAKDRWIDLPAPLLASVPGGAPETPYEVSGFLYVHRPSRRWKHIQGLKCPLARKGPSSITPLFGVLL